MEQAETATTEEVVASPHSTAILDPATAVAAVDATLEEIGTFDLFSPGLDAAVHDLDHRTFSACRREEFFLGQEVADTEKTLRIHTFILTVFLLAMFFILSVGM